MQALQRDELLRQMADKTFDLLIIGGGITGAGIALDAASRGLSVALVEKNDFASGTSSRSTKLIHGGLRYLKQYEFQLVREVGSERAIVHKLAPHLVVPRKMLLPIIKDGNYGKNLTSLGLWVYDVLAGVKGDDRRVILSKEKTLLQEPLLREDILEGGGYYAEYRTDDARLTVELMKKALSLGAICLNYTRVKDFVYNADQTIQGALLQDEIDGNPIMVTASCIVNAAGPWVDELRKADGSLQGKRLHLTKGVHIVVPRDRFPIRQAVYFDVPDGRMIFAIPRGKITYIGTTDTDYTGIKEKPRTLQKDVDYLLQGLTYVFPGIALTSSDVVSSWAGLRPLIHQDGKSASELSRKDEVFISSTGLISIAGGKLTGYRKMAEKVCNLVVNKLGKGKKRSITKNLPLAGSDFSAYGGVEAYERQLAKRLKDWGLDAYFAEYITHNYGTQGDTIIGLMEQREEQDPSLRLLLAELDFAIKWELVQKPVDFFIRRTGLIYFDIDRVRAYRSAILDAFSKKWNWGTLQLDQAQKELDDVLLEASEFPLTETVVHPSTLDSTLQPS